MERRKNYSKKREAILAYLRSTDAHPTAECVYRQLKPSFPDLSLGTVYRNLSLFKQEGVIGSACIEDGMERFDRNAAPHAQFVCNRCHRVMDLNVKGMFHCARGAVPWMERQGRGVILNTSSMVSFYGQPAGVAYPVSKFAVNGFTLSLARELAPKGIRVNAVAPGIIETDMLRAVPREVLAPLEAQIPLGRVGQPGEVAEAFVFLASEQASYITGVVLRVDGLARA